MKPVFIYIGNKIENKKKIKNGRNRRNRVTKGLKAPPNVGLSGYG
jgi:hypothetical protein